MSETGKKRLNVAGCMFGPASKEGTNLPGYRLLMGHLQS